jgi:hypothetical protein
MFAPDVRWPGLAVVSLATVVAGCSGSDPTETATATPSASATTSATASAAGSPGSSPIALGELAAGRYTHTAFTPRIVVEVPDGGWQTFHLSRDFFDVAIETDDGPVAIMFIRPQAFVTPHGEFEPASPEEAIDLLGHYEGVSISEARAMEIDGIAGVEVDVTFDVDNTHVIRVTDGLIGFGPQTDVRLAYLEVDGELLVIGLNVPAGSLEDSEELAQPVLESIQIGS